MSTDALLARLRELEGERLRARAPANRLARRRWENLRGYAPVVVLPIVFFGILFLLGALEYRRMANAPDMRARMDARVLHPVAEKWRAEHPDEPCPTVTSLVAARELSTASKLTDPWERLYAITCDGDDVSVSSAGPDRTFGTGDDIRTPGIRMRVVRPVAVGGDAGRP